MCLLSIIRYVSRLKLERSDIESDEMVTFKMV